LKAKIVNGKTYHNPFMKQDFSVEKTEDPNVFKCTYEDSKVKMWDRKDLQSFLQNSIDRQLPHWELNIHNKVFWTTDLVRQGISEIDQIMEKLQIVVEDERTEWTDSKYERFKNLSNQTKGVKAGEVYCCHLEALGKNVAKNDKGEYDFDINRIIIVDGIKQTIRSACIKETAKSLTLNSIRKFVDWDKLICFLVFPTRIEIYETHKDLIYRYLDENPKEIGWILPEPNMEVIHWHMKYPLPNIFTKIISV
jgi:hypothetical protein